LNAGQPGPLVSADWLASHLDDADLRLVHVSIDRQAYDGAHIPGAMFVDLHVDLAKPGERPETGTTSREYLVPNREEVADSLASWGVAPGTRIVFYDDAGFGRHAIRGYWLLRLYGYPRERLHVLDGGLGFWQAEGRATTSEAFEPFRVAATEQLHEMDRAVIATAEEVLTWSREAGNPNSPTRLLDVRTAEEFRGIDVRSRRGGHVPGAANRPFEDFVAPDGRLRSAAEAIALVKDAGVDPEELRATYCQGGVRASLVWFVLSEVAGLTNVRDYAESWEEWGNRPDLPIEE
jgi:thiosulfate/3-mercaptopyruvate sulfurtransferase